jgi:hypothetical protein
VAFEQPIVTHAKANTVIAVNKRKSRAAISHHHPLPMKFCPFIGINRLLKLYLESINSSGAELGVRPLVATGPFDLEGD